ncbi:ABC transporter ATP-binding protein [candidate division CSSED10-310 bacterium]|uniref:ABC transporter ATP-binding protein n=1 Tax=candidate division CSSED10-310 bacterium TaxID=2855610 RepID=A0ABV6YSV8_UNCC1
MTRQRNIAFSKHISGENTTILETKNLTKRYGRIDVLQCIDLHLEQGQIYGLLGRDGAGKTTALKIILGITPSSGGFIKLFGQLLGANVVALRQKIGYVAQEQHFYDWMTPVSICQFVRGLYPTWDNGEYYRTIEQMDLPSGRKIRTFSESMKTMLALALAIAHQPQLLILDEPTAGLDKVTRHEFMERIKDISKNSERTILFSSNDVHEIEQLADHLGIIDRGIMKYEGSIHDLSAGIRLFRCSVYEQVSGSSGAPMKASSIPPPPFLATRLGFQVIEDQVRNDDRELIVQAEHADLFNDIGTELGGWRMEQPTLENIYISMVRHK